MWFKVLVRCGLHDSQYVAVLICLSARFLLGQDGGPPDSQVLTIKPGRNIIDSPQPAWLNLIRQADHLKTPLEGARRQMTSSYPSTRL